MEKQRTAPAVNPNAKAGDALPLPIGITNKLFFVLFFTTSYYVIRSWRDKMTSSTPLHILTFTELAAVIVQIASFVYFIGFFGIEYLQNFLPKEEAEQELLPQDSNQAVRPSCGDFDNGEKTNTKKIESNEMLQNMTDEEIALAVKKGQVQSYTLESALKDCTRAASVRRGAVEMITGKSLQGLPLEGFNYESILGQCCELPVGFVQIPLGVAGPLLVDGQEYYVPMATTEGCLVASTNRGCKAIHVSGGANSVLLRDGMTRAPAVRFGSVVRASELKFYLEDAEKYAKICQVFNSTSRFAKLQSLKCSLAGKNAYLRFCCSTGDAMGMNMVSKGTQNVIDFLQEEFPDMDVISISGNFCADKKATAVNWIEGRGKSVVCEAVISGKVVAKVLKTTVPALVELNMLKNLTGSAMAGAVGGFNAHAANIVSAVFLATGQDPAQNVESSHCLTMMEAVNDGDDLHVSVTMPCIEVGTVGGGTQLASQAACLNLLGVKGANKDCPGVNAQTLARIVAGAVLAGELSLMSALAAGQLVKSHMKFNRASPSSTK